MIRFEMLRSVTVLLTTPEAIFDRDGFYSDGERPSKNEALKEVAMKSKRSMEGDCYASSFLVVEGRLP